MPELSEAERDRLPDSAFAYIDSHGGRHLPIPDEEHVRNAIARFGRTHFESSTARQRAAFKILEAARRYGIAVDPEDDVSRATR